MFGDLFAIHFAFMVNPIKVYLEAEDRWARGKIKCSNYKAEEGFDSDNS